MTNDLLAWVDAQLAKSELDDETRQLILAALAGDADLDAYLADGTTTVRAERADDQLEEEAGGTFLASMAVEGFRGIGPRVEVPLSPRPGLTIIAGRNGSGKSSISEALEFVLTGDTYRWKSKKVVEWRQYWRNIQHPHAAITATFVEEDAAPVTVSAAWSDEESDLAAAKIISQRRSAKQMDGISRLGWTQALEQYRPILSYEELGGLLESGRVELHKALASILGVEKLAHAFERVNSRLKEHKAPATEAAARRKQLVSEARAVSDARAEVAARLLRKTSPDLVELRALSTGSAVPDTGPLQPLRHLAALSLPFTADDVASTVRAVRAAVSSLADANAETSERSVARLELLESALRVHADHGDMSCPVCRTGSLDDEWRRVSADLAAEQRKDLNDVTLARQTLGLTLGAARRLVIARPAVLESNPDVALGGVFAEARTAWDAWTDAPAGMSAQAALALADHLESRCEPLLAAVRTAGSAARSRLSELEDLWQPLATHIATWCDEWSACLAAQPIVDRLSAADTWLKANDLRLKNERLAPIQTGAKAAWAKLRQESNIELGALTLTGSGKQRRVRIDAAVDGTEVQGFTVLSQGELHALALSLFLPRATMASSPFRFLVLDDPVQAMDPAKVDGLVELLGGLAKDRQVIVLSHDDRLPAAVRRSNLDATILEVTRATNSRVAISTATDPAQRYLADALGLVLETEQGRLNETAMRRTLPGLLRFAVEAASKDTFFASSLRAGAALSDLEDAWETAGTTRQKVMLALFSELRENHELDNWASAPYRKFGLRNVGTAMHGGLKADLDPRDAVRDVERLVGDLRGTS